MGLLKNISGQDNAVKYLCNCLEKKRIANGYLFAGPDGVGKALTARSFIKSLMCREPDHIQEPCGCLSCRKIEKGEHPDVIWIDPERKRRIKIDEIRKVKDILNLKPFESDSSVCVIADAHLMTVEASNALLKILEEPPGKSLLMLLSDKRELILPTVISRCVEVKFNYLSTETTAAIIQNILDLGDEDADFLARISGGSPGRAMAMAGGGLVERKNHIMGKIYEILNSGEAGLMRWDNEDKEGLTEDLELMIAVIRDIAVGKLGLKSLLTDRRLMEGQAGDLPDTCSFERLYRVMDRLISMKKDLEGNINTKLAAQVLPGIVAGGTTSGPGYV